MSCSSPTSRATGSAARRRVAGHRRRSRRPRRLRRRRPDRHPAHCDAADQTDRSRLEVDQDAAGAAAVASARVRRARRLPLHLQGAPVHDRRRGRAGRRRATCRPSPAEQLPFIGHLGAASLPADDRAVRAADRCADGRRQAREMGHPGRRRRAAPARRRPSARCGSTRSSRRCRARRTSAAARSRGRSRSWTRPASRVEREINGLDPQARVAGTTRTTCGPTFAGHDLQRQLVRPLGKQDRPRHRRRARLESRSARRRRTSSRNPNEHSDHFETLTLPSSAESNLLSVRRPTAGWTIVDSDRPARAGTTRTVSGSPPTAARIVVPNVFKGLGVAGSISILDTERTRSCASSRAPAMQMPVAAGIKGKGQQGVCRQHRQRSGQRDRPGLEAHVKNIPVTLTPDCQCGAAVRRLRHAAGADPDAGQPGRPLRRRGGAVADDRRAAVHRLARSRGDHRHGAPTRS